MHAMHYPDKLLEDSYRTWNAVSMVEWGLEGVVFLHTFVVVDFSFDCVFLCVRVLCVGIELCMSALDYFCSFVIVVV